MKTDGIYTIFTQFNIDSNVNGVRLRERMSESLVFRWMRLYFSEIDQHFSLWVDIKLQFISLEPDNWSKSTQCLSFMLREWCTGSVKQFYASNVYNEWMRDGRNRIDRLHKKELHECEILCRSIDVWCTEFIGILIHFTSFPWMPTDSNAWRINDSVLHKIGLIFSIPSRKFTVASKCIARFVYHFTISKVCN